MKIGIITFHAAFNYGSMLQAWALQSYLQDLGHQVEIVNYRSSNQKKIYYKPFKWNNIYSLRSSLKRLLLYPSSIEPLNKKWHLFDDFLHQELHLSKEYHSIEELKEASFDYDLLICGSDQIWNTNAPDADEAYFGNFVGKKTKKISYAASFGQYPGRINTDYVKQHLINFNTISVREIQSKELLLNYGLAADVKVVCDPTFLLDACQYVKLLGNERIIKDPYIFFYTPVGLPIKYLAIAEQLAEQTGLPVITERAYYPKDIKPFKHIKNHIETGPREFLNLIYNAEYVIGGSFHLQVFSILLKKKFFCINGDKDSRTNNLLNILGLTERIISLHKAVNFKTIDSINNWDQTDILLDEFKKDSMNFLSEYLS